MANLSPVSTTRVDGPSWWVTGYPVTRQHVTRQLGPLTRAVNSGSGNRALLY